MKTPLTLKVRLIKPTPAEDLDISNAMANDPDAFEISDFSKARRGRPKLETPKQPVSIRLDAEVVDYFRASGKGWQSRMNEVLARFVNEDKQAS